jgi:8-oxo-dGTP pyrophosphatase MutT (NUDIX family)
MTPARLDQVQAALALENFAVLAAQRRMAPQPRALRRSPNRPGQPRQAGVLILLYPAQEGLAFALIRRTQNPHDVHSGQISLPGGSLEPGETPVEAALREAKEELGLDVPVQVLGSLTCLYIPPSDFEVHPAVGYVNQRPVWVPDRSEVVEVLECPLAWLLDDTRKVVEAWERDGQTVQVPWYNMHGHKVWGATAIILSEFEHRLRHVLDEPKV